AVRAHLRRDVPAVFLTGDTARTALAEAKLARALVLSKPVRADDLLEALRTQAALDVDSGRSVA
ncbi:MAG TPA: hypothetical protein VFO94_10300, partial [Gammaproteobacteria bacterium]|nr:hypothetical protein [Gammaproteobacteria bacterium]